MSTVTTATKRVRALRNKTTATAATKVAASATKVPVIVAPIGGFRTATVRDRAVMAAISANPGRTPLELSIISGFYTQHINDALYMTREGRRLAENGLVARSDRGAAPRWYASLGDKSKVRSHSSANFLPTLILGKVKAGTKSDWTPKANLISQALFRRTSSPTILKTLAQEINAVLLISALRQDSTERKLVSTTKRLATAKLAIANSRAEKKLLLTVRGA